MFTRKLEQLTGLDEKRLSELKKHSVPGGWDSQESIVVDFKAEMKDKLCKNQQGKCAYCELSLATRAPEIEHIAPKGGPKQPKHVECMFQPLNLVLACRRCNSPTCKGRKDTVVTKNGSDDYSEWSFRIVHPYLDDPADYFEMNSVDNGEIGPIPLIKRTADTAHQIKAQNTIDMFKLNSEEVILELAKQRLAEKMPDQIANFIQNISTYRPPIR